MQLSAAKEAYEAARQDWLTADNSVTLMRASIE